MRRGVRLSVLAALQIGLFLIVGLATVVASRLFDAKGSRRSHLELVSKAGAQLARLQALMARRDDATLGHCGRVATNARRLALALGLSSDEVDVVYWTGMFHDIGKLGVRQAVLQKRGPLDPLDWLEVERHPDLGADLLGWMGPEFAQIATGVRAHHERWDGTGYPQRKAGTDIPLAGRIVAIVDAFEALTSERAYSAAVPPHRAMSFLNDDAGTHFDPSIVPVFDDLWRRGEVRVAGERRDETPLLDASPIWLTGSSVWLRP